MSTPGFVLQNRYQVVRVIAQGGSGAVFQAQDQRLNGAVALKELRISDPQLRATFGREAQLLAGLRHSALPKITDYFSEGDAEYLVMEFIPGPNLAELLQQRGRPFPVDQVLRWADQLLDALEYLHWQQIPIVHRDIKPQNLKLTDRGDIILLDFGLTKGAVAQTLPMSGNSIGFQSGSPYLPIEQIRGFGVDGRSDIYSLGATLYHLLTGQPPLDAVSRATDMAGGQPDYLLPANRANIEVPIALSNLVSNALALNRDQRPDSAAVFRGRLRELGLTESANRSNYATVAVQPPPANQPTVQFVQSPPPAPTTRPELTTRPLAPMPQPIATQQFGQAQPIGTPQFSQPQPIVAQQFGQQPAQGQGKKSSSIPWLIVLVVALLILFVSIIVIAVAGPGLYFWRGTAHTVSNTGKPKVIIPSPYDESLKSVATVVMQNADGQTVGQSSGFFLRDDQIVVPLTVIDNAAKGHVRLAGKTADFDIASVIAVDRDRGLAILKLDAPTAPSVAFNADRKLVIGDKLALLGSDSNSEAQYIEAAVSDYKQNEDLIEIRFSGDISRGSVVLDDHGQAVGMITATPSNDPYLKIATPIARVAALSKREQPALSIALAGATQVLLDFRKPYKGRPSPKLSPAAQEKILSTIFPAYLKAGETCRDDVYGIEEARRLGQINPDIEDSISGSFTAPGVKQIAYIINVGECNASHAEGFGTKRLVIFENQKLVANVDTDQHSGIIQISDLDQDGINELLLYGAAMGQGTSVEAATLVDFHDGKYRVIHDFGQIRYDSCGSGLKKSSMSALAVFYAPSVKGEFPEFRTDVYRANCGGKFRYLTTGKLPDQ